MKVLQSYWFAKFRSEKTFGGFHDERSFWHSTVLSAFSIAQFYEAELVTDSYGAECAEFIGLPYRAISRSFDSLPQQLSQLWALGKLWLYQQQSEPFLHIDLDAYLWERLPQRCEEAEVVIQVYEDDPRQLEFYRRVLGALLEKLPCLPDSYRDPQLLLRTCLGVNCGVVGGSRLDLFQSYAAESASIMTDPRNMAAWEDLYRSFGSRFGWFNAGIEQTNLLLWCERFGVVPEAVVPNAFAPGRDIRSEKLGFTHLVGEEKENPRMREALRARVKKEYSQQYNRIDELVGRHP